LSVAPGDPKRARPVPWPALLGLAALGAAALFLAFPKGSLVDYVRREVGTGRATLVLEYLRGMLRSEPENWELHLLMAERLTLERQWNEAEAALRLAERFAPDGDSAAESLRNARERLHLGRWAEADEAAERGAIAPLLRLAETEVHRLRAAFDRVENARQWRRLQATAEQLAARLQPWEPAKADALRAMSARAFAAHALAWADSVDGAAQLADQALALGLPGLAAELRAAAFALCGQLVECLQHWHAAVGNRLASGDARSAWPWALQTLGPLGSNPPASVALALARTAAAAGQAQAAATWLARPLRDASGFAHWAASAAPADWEWAWTIAAGGGDLALAQQLAQAAVERGLATIWLERLALASQWRGDAGRALAVWSLAWQRAGQRTALDAVERLATAAHDDRRLVAAWELARERGMLDEPAKRLELARAYERLGEPQQALAILEPLARGGDPQWSWELARLLVRMGAVRPALGYFERARQSGAWNGERALTVALATLPLADYALTLRWLRSAEPATAKADDFATYWQLRADLEHALGDEAASERSLRTLIAARAERPDQAERLLIALSRRPGSDWLREARAAALRHSGSSPLRAQWQMAVLQRGGIEDWNDYWRSQSVELRAGLERQGDFMAARAAFWLRHADWQAARADLEAAVALQPRQHAWRAQLMWLLIDRRERAALVRQMGPAQALLGRGEDDAALRGALAQAWLLLDQPRRALALLQRELRRRSDDPLWLLGYAEALYRSGDESGALDVRRRVYRLLALQSPEATQSAAANARQRLQAWLDLAKDHAALPEQRRAWAALLAQLRAVRDWRAAEARPLREMLGLWLLAQDQYPTLDYWLWQQHAWRLMTPAYQTFAAALRAQDGGRLSESLERDTMQTDPSRGSGPGSVESVGVPTATAELPGPQGPIDPKDRLTALRLLGRVTEAAKLGTELDQRRAEGVTEDLAPLIVQDLAASSQRLEASVHQMRSPALQQQLQALAGSHPQGESLRFEWRLDTTRLRRLGHEAVLPAPRGSRHVASASLSGGLTQQGRWHAQTWLHSSVGSSDVGLALRVEWKLGPRALAQIAAARSEPSALHDAARIDGLQDRLQFGMSLRPSAMLQTNAQLQWLQLRSVSDGRPRARLGRVEAGLSYDLRRDEPDWRIALQWQWQKARAAGPVLSPAERAAWVPASGQGFRLAASWGLQSAMDPAYVRDWRPWLELGWSVAPGGSGGPDVRWGVRGMLVGRDQLIFDARLAPRRGPNAEREWRLDYRRHFE
jgi:hypothetical protein